MPEVGEMREIKFRAWHKGQLKMCPVIKIDFREKAQTILLGENSEVGYLIASPKQVELMQYTGLKDKNGKEIYEGDIVREIYPVDTPKSKRLVCDIWFNPEDAHFVERRFDNGRIMFIHGEHIEVIGNIYENKELLNEKT